MKISGLEIKRSIQEKTAKRNYHAATTGNLFGSWLASNNTADTDIKRDLKTIRARSRELMRNDDYAKRFKRMVKSNTVGNNGIRLQNRAKDSNGSYDKKANDIIEDAFKRWSKKGVCDVTGRYSLKEIQKMIMGTLAEDGEVLVRKVKGYRNEFKFAIQLLEADHLDENYNEPDRNIHMGIEYDSWNRPVAYHLFKTHPGNLTNVDKTRERIPANEINHLFLSNRISATRGIPWMHTAMTRMKMVNGYEEAELTASRISAAKGGFYVSKDGAEEYEGDTIDDRGNLVNELEPGQIELLPKGIDFKNYDPQHPTTAFKDFMKVILRGISSGLDVSYNTLSNDLESVNYSSLRSGVLEEREVWKDLQVWLGENFLDDLFSDWLDMALLSKAVPLPYFKYEKFNQPSWLYRGFAWVDPLKDMQANILACKEGLKTHSQIANEMGMDLEELYAELQKEKDLRQKYGITTVSEAEIAQILKQVNNGENNEA